MGEEGVRVSSSSSSAVQARFLGLPFLVIFLYNYVTIF